MTAGRPSGYSRYADQITVAVSEGFTLREIARALGMRHVRLFRWLRTHPAFRSAVDAARAIAERERAKRLAEILNRDSAQ